MRAPVSWIADWAELPAGLAPTELSDALIRVGLEVERVESGADGLSGPIVVGRAVTVEPEPQKNGKTINWCTVDVGEAEPRGIVCGAHNFGPGDLVVVALPGAVLPGGFAIAARKTYGHVSDGMICSVRELGTGDDHAGILVLDADTSKPGDDALDVLGLRDAILDIAVTPDRGYCFSIRGLAREAAIALDVAFRDVADSVTVPTPNGRAYDVTIDDATRCDQFAIRVVNGVDPQAPTPDFMARRLRQAGMRPISLIVDVTNYVMLETGQPLHAYDYARLAGPLGVRVARTGEVLKTLDDVERRLDPDDTVVTDDSGPIGLAGVMGGASTEISANTSRVLLEAARWNPAATLRTVRRHKLPSEAGKRFERGVDPRIAEVALARCVELLETHGGGIAEAGATLVSTVAAPAPIVIDARLPADISGLDISPETTARRLEQIGATVTGFGPLSVLAPTWRPDLTDPADLVEEVVRLEGYENIPSTLPTPPPGRGLTEAQRVQRAVSRAVAAAGYVEVLAYPFVSASALDSLGLPAADPRRDALHVVNPLSDAEPDLRTTLLPGLLQILQRNLGRGLRDVALYEIGLVFLGGGDHPRVPLPGVDHRPSPAEYQALLGSVPDQPRHLGAVAVGMREPAGWWGPGQPASWSDMIELARTVATQYRVNLDVVAADHAPWHPGRCAQLRVGDVVVGYAGELHPRVIAAFDLPPRTVALELDLDAFALPGPALTPVLSGFPPVLLDVALVVDESVRAADVQAALRQGAGPLLESVRLFDVYTDPDRLGAGVKSLAFALRLRASDRTLTGDEANAVRDAAIAAAARETGAILRA